MENENDKVKLRGQLKEALLWHNKYEDSSRKEFLVDKGVYDKAEKISKIRNTDVEGIFTIATYRILKERENCSSLN